MASSGQDADAVTTWLRENAIPLRHLEPGNGFDDILPLKELWRDVRVVGLGESTHGTREFFQIKHRLLEFLARELGFTVFAIEASHTACEPLNAWIQGIEGDLELLLSGIHYLAWNTEEFVAMVSWMRAWNEAAPEGRRVTFLGVDMTFNERGRDAVLAYLQHLAPQQALEAERIFGVIGEVEPGWPFRIDEDGMAAVRDVLPALDNLTTWFDDHQDEFANRSSRKELDRIRFYLQLMSQWWRDSGNSRTAHVGMNLLHLLDRDHPGERAVFWAHNGHVDAGTYPGGRPKAGHYLREKFGLAYYACALEFGEGSYQYRVIEPGPIPGDISTEAIGPPSPCTVPWHLQETGIGSMLVNLRAPTTHLEVERWLGTPQQFHGIGWAHADSPASTDTYEDVTPGASFDGILQVAHSTPARPTKTALEHATRKERF